MRFGHKLIPVKRILHFSRRWLRGTIDYSKNYYEILEVTRDATQQQIKNAFYTLSKKYHPDVTGSAPGSALTERFLAIKEAYDVLKDANSRHDYDTHRAQTSSDYARRAYNSRTYDDRSAGYGTWRSNRYSGSTQFRSGWPYSDAHLKRVFEEMRRRAEEYERIRREEEELYWERFYQRENERYRRRRETTPRPNIGNAIDSWLDGPLRPYLPYLSLALVAYMIGFFLFSLYSLTSSKKVPGGEDGNVNSEQAKFNEMVARERFAHDMEHIQNVSNIVTHVNDKIKSSTP